MSERRYKAIASRHEIATPNGHKILRVFTKHFDTEGQALEWLDQEAITGARPMSVVFREPHINEFGEPIEGS